eukprot:6779290-Pyramimonas_sp.AAC.1
MREALGEHGPWTAAASGEGRRGKRTAIAGGPLGRLAAGLRLRLAVCVLAARTIVLRRVPTRVGFSFLAEAVAE